jgi:hypothetical protein
LSIFTLTKIQASLSLSLLALVSTLGSACAQDLPQHIPAPPGQLAEQAQAWQIQQMQQMQHMHGMAPMHQHMMDPRHLNDMANRLEIKASQQAQWDEFASALQAFHREHHPHDHNPSDSSKMGAHGPSSDLMDAAQMMKARAQKMTERAALMTALAEKTEALQKVLSPEQQTTLNQMTGQLWMWHHAIHHNAYWPKH